MSHKWQCFCFCIRKQHGTWVNSISPFKPRQHTVTPMTHPPPYMFPHNVHFRCLFTPRAGEGEMKTCKCYTLSTCQLQIIFSMQENAACCTYFHFHLIPNPGNVVVPPQKCLPQKGLFHVLLDDICLMS